jgi:GNAT superfamily N-acetyltransferase
MLGISYRQSRHRIDGSRAEWFTVEDIEETLWPVDLRDVRLWPMESEDGPLLQQLFDDLTDFRSAFGEPGMADAVSTFLNVPEGYGYEAKLLVGIWRDGGLVGALDCITGYPTDRDWTIGLLVVAERHRDSGIAAAVLRWLEKSAKDRVATCVRGVLNSTNRRGISFAKHQGYTITASPTGHLLATKRLSY